MWVCVWGIFCVGDCVVLNFLVALTLFFFFFFFCICIHMSVCIYVCVCVCLHQRIDIMVRVLTNGMGDQGSIPGQVILKTQKMVLDATLLNAQYYEVQIKVKWSNPGKGVEPTPTPRHCSYWKGSLRVTLNCNQPTYSFFFYLLSSVGTYWKCRTCTFSNNDWLDKCEACYASRNSK